MKKRLFVVLLGSAMVEDIAVVESAAAMAGAEVVHEPKLDGVGAWMAAPSGRPIAVVMSMSMRHVARAAVAFRERHATVAMPLIGVASSVHDIAYEEAFTSGFDDICGRDARQLGRRLRHVAEVGPADVPRSDTRVLIADEDRKSRLLVARVFRDAGYDVAFAADAAETIERAGDERVRVVVSNASLERGDETLLRAAAEQGHEPVWIVSTPPKEMPQMQARISDEERGRVSVHDAFACPATLLFVANELLNNPAEDGRKSERLLYGTTVRFRHAGRGDCDVGYVYNLSGGGLYVRTLAPPARWDELWLEFTPPRCDRLVHIEGTAVWARRYGPVSSATVPCGFGLQITGASKTDRLRYRRSYRTFLKERVEQRRGETQRPESLLTLDPGSLDPGSFNPSSILPRSTQPSSTQPGSLNASGLNPSSARPSSPTNAAPSAGSLQAGSLAPGSLAPGSLAPGSLAPSSLAPAAQSVPCPPS